MCDGMKSRYSAFFEDHGDYFLKVYFYECSDQFTVEELYQAIKERLVNELVVTSSELLEPATIEDFSNT